MGSTGALLNRQPQRTRGSDFAPLLREIKASGLLERRTAPVLDLDRRQPALSGRGRGRA